MPGAAHFDSYSTARAHFKELLDAARRGRVTTVQRETGRAAVVDAERLRANLIGVLPSPQVAEDGGWSVFLPGVPVAADAATFDEAIEEMIEALREYADDWQERLLDAPNHRNNWALIRVVSSATTPSCASGWWARRDEPTQCARTCFDAACATAAVTRRR